MANVIHKGEPNPKTISDIKTKMSHIMTIGIE